MSYHFSKMHGLGNDFVILDGISQNLPLTPTFIQAIASRHTGIGCDQVLVLKPSKRAGADFHYQIFNADGTRVGQCGNGARCIGRYLAIKHLTQKKQVVLHTDTTQLTLELNDDQTVSVKFAPPMFAPSTIPFNTAKQAISYPLTLPDNSVITACVLSLGNPHAVIITDDLNKSPVNSIGEILNTSSYFPKGVNVGFLQVISSHNISLRVFERGAGETLACGSGACAAVVAGNLLGLLDEASHRGIKRR